MISKRVYKYCKDDLSLIENYELAINDNKQMWDCHHRLEIKLNVSAQYLIDNNLYFNRPASELIFLTKSEHSSIHNVGERNINYKKTGEKNPMYGKNPEYYMSYEAIIQKREKQSKAVLKEKNGRYHTKQMYKDGVYETVKYNDIQNRLNDGWIIKGKPNILNGIKKNNGRYHTKQMYKDGVYETVKYNDIQNRLNNGWILKGRHHRSKKA